MGTARHRHHARGGKSSVRPCAPGGLVDKILHQRGRCTAHREHTQNAGGLALCVTATCRIRPAQCGVGVCAVPILGSGLRPRLCARRCLRPDRASLFCFFAGEGASPGALCGAICGGGREGRACVCGNRGGMRAPLHRGGKRAGVSRCNARGLPPEYAAQTRRKWAELEFGTFGGVWGVFDARSIRRGASIVVLRRDRQWQCGWLLGSLV